MTERLDWPAEAARPRDGDMPSLSAPGSNICLDFHGDPKAAKLVVFSDGNHHMALGECVARFLAANPDADDVFYTTTPPGPLVAALEKGALRVGNLTLSLRPDVFIGPGEILDKLVASGVLESHRPFAESRGCALLVRKGNPKKISAAADFLRDDVRIAMSNPQSEKASFQVYAETLEALAIEAGEDGLALRKRLSAGDGVVFSKVIHHREVPEIIAAGGADVAVVYYHLALRYVRIFPDAFDMVALGGTVDEPQPGPAHRITRYHLGLLGEGGDWGGAFAGFMTGADAKAIYEIHGLRHLA
jgi:ABC-type molybdate transport system substrate-binding protein